MKPFSYHKATSIEDAITQRAATGARLLAGGTDLIAQMKAGSRTPDVVVDVKGVAELNQIATGGDGELIIGAAVSAARLAREARIKTHHPGLHDALGMIGGWKDCVGEDIVLTWAMLAKGWRVGHAENALCFTNVPENVPQLIRQRKRWSRGMIEAFRHHPRILVSGRMTTLFAWWNLLFPWLDLAYTLFFIPGVILALFGIYWIAGPMTLVLLPMGLAMNYVMYRIGVSMFTEQGLKVRRLSRRD